MSRKKTIELPPVISSFEVDGEVIALEIPHPDHKEIGKGSHKKNLVEARAQKLIDEIYLDFFTTDAEVDFFSATTSTTVFLVSTA